MTDANVHCRSLWVLSPLEVDCCCLEAEINLVTIYIVSVCTGALCEGLADYNAQIQALKAEMEDATRIADALRCAAICLAALTKWSVAVEPVAVGLPTSTSPCLESTGEVLCVLL